MRELFHSVQCNFAPSVITFKPMKNDTAILLDYYLEPFVAIHVRRSLNQEANLQAMIGGSKIASDLIGVAG